VTAVILLAAGGALAQARGPMPLVDADEELAGFVKQAQQHIQDGQYEEAIRILHAMIMRPRSGFFPASDPRQYISMRTKANEVLGAMPPEGLRLYRSLHDAQAAQEYEEAMASGEPLRLRRLAERYLHTTHGARILETLAAMLFDRGQFAEAARCWQRALALNPPEETKALAMAEIAAAHHLAGQAEASGRVLASLREAHPNARAVLGGRERNLVAFVEEVQRLPVASRRPARATQAGWPGLASLPGGMGVMDDCDVVLEPRWRQPEEPLSSGDAPAALLAGQDVLRIGPQQRNRTTTAKLRDGHIRVEARYGSQRHRFTLPAFVRPIVLNDLVIYRTDEQVVARDVYTGQLVWQTFDFCLYRSAAPAGAEHAYYYYGKRVTDAGWYALTVGDDKLFALYGFLPSAGGVLTARWGMVRAERNRKPTDNSGLAAISLESEGRLVWTQGAGQSDDDVIRAGKFLSAPAYDAGRLYVLVKHVESYYLVCLRSEDGSLVWKTAISQTPAILRQHGYDVETLLGLGTPPTVVDGRAFVLTNAGALAAFDADTGQPVWAYQYDSALNAGPDTMSRLHSRLASLHYPANPIIVSSGRVICLPADSDSAVAVSSSDGELLWQANRRGQHDLTGIDDDRVLLSGEGLMVLSSGDGRTLAAPLAAKDIHGRPAVTPTVVMAGGEGVVYKLYLDDYRFTIAGTVSPDGILGNLVSVDGKLIGANAAGVCVYLGYDVAHAKLSARIEALPPSRQAGLLYQRGHLAFSARRYEEALADFLACRRLAEQHAESALADQVRLRLYRCYVALADHCQTVDGMFQMFGKAQALAQTRQEKGHMLLRMAKCHRQAGAQKRDKAHLVKAVELAQQITEQFAEEPLVDVAIGPEADVAVRMDSRSRTIPGRKLAETFIAAMLEAHGRDCYAAFDARAGEELRRARQDGDPEKIRAVGRRWPLSEWADDALFTAAEVYYRQASQADGRKAERLFGQAIGCLCEVHNDSKSPLRASASVALATIYARGGKRIAARLTLDRVRELPADTTVKFADIQGRIGEIIKRLDAGEVPTRPLRVEQRSQLLPPLQKAWSIEDDIAVILRDQEYRPIRIGESVLALQGSRAVLLDTSARDAGSAVAWAGLVSVDAATFERLAAYPPGRRLIAGRSGDGKTILVADRGAATGFDLRTAKRRWHVQFKDAGLAAIGCMGIGGGVLVAADGRGAVACLEAATGELRWKARLVGGGRRTPSGPIRIGGRLALLRHDGGRVLTCFDTRSGKVVAKWKAGTAAGYFTEGGLLVTLTDGSVAAYDTGDLSKPLWKREYERSAFPGVIAVGAGHVAVAPDQARSEIEVLSVMGGGRTVAEFSAGNDGEQRSGVEGRFDASSLFVACSLKQVGGRSLSVGYPRAGRGIELLKFDLERKRMSWRLTLDGDAGSVCRILPLQVGVRHVVVTASRSSRRVSHYVVDRESGRLAETLPAGKDEGAAARGKGFAGAGPAVVTDGRLCVETDKALAVYWGRGQ
jgi:outer membrane protein assembly factor BamB